MSETPHVHETEEEIAELQSITEIEENELDNPLHIMDDDGHDEHDNHGEPPPTPRRPCKTR